MKSNLNEKLKNVFRFLERTQTHKILTYYFAVFLQRLRLTLIFPAYLYGMNKLAVKTWIHKIKFRTEVPGHLMVLHYNQNAVKNPAVFVKQIEESVVKPFRRLHKVNPAVLILPFGSTFQAGSYKGFVRSLDRDQKRELVQAIHELKNENQIEIITQELAA
ncbi:hypothetical protein EHQ76_07270 [Leptospira barantonii]|uniref:Acyltransferase n=1 Tax=Leptospira barantonii TaxID=2023184 RepID=A0A5F2BHG6_9LEPT|nr:hypothetical protein [Leptospira barantonii]TGM04837.1 hypothetical protein EHQ76_07270 [Leptospira barantonii]